MISIQDYLNQEGFIERNWEEILEIIKRHNPKLFEGFTHFLERWERSEIPSREFYEQISASINGTCMYELLKARSRKSTEWDLENVQEFTTNGKRMIDVCCGPGLEATYFASLFPETKVVGIDASQGMIAQAKRRKERLKLDNLEFSVGDRDALQFPDKSFDLVACFHSFYDQEDDGFGFHYEAFQTAQSCQRIKDLTRVLDTGGKLILSHPVIPFQVGIKAHQFKSWLHQEGYKDIITRDASFEDVDNFEYAHLLTVGTRSD